VTNHTACCDSAFFKIEAPTIEGVLDFGTGKRLKTTNQVGYLKEIRIRELDSKRLDQCVLVNNKTPIKYRRAVERLAYYFKREFQYDFVQFVVSESNEDNYEAWLFYTQTEQIIGACTFRKRNLKNRPDIKWRLDWIWFHPYVRREGLLTKNWKFFKEIYGLFALEFPLSGPMKQFLLKNYFSELENIYPGVFPRS